MLVHDRSRGHDRGGWCGWLGRYRHPCGEGWHDHLWSRRAVAERGVRAHLIVEAEIPADRGAGLGDRVVSSEVDLLVLDRSPEPLDEDVVAPGTLAVHADGDPISGQRTGESLAGELAALIGVEDLWPAVAGQGLFQRLDAERRLQG